jgi:Recombination endonuclease VII/HNH endonuclease
MYLKKMPLTFEQVNELIAYDPQAGSFTWKKSPSRGAKVGAPCGKSYKGTGGKYRYRYINVLEYSTPAARVAWLLTYGKWPETNVTFKDGDSENLRIDNLKEADFASIKEIKDGRRRYKMSHAQQRHHGLKRYYGITLETYNVMLAAQNGVCDICKGVETYVPKGHGTPKPLSVDHNHETGQIRGLLCSNCNYVIGHCKEDRAVLLTAAKYLDKHNATAPTVPALTLVPTAEDSK